MSRGHAQPHQVPVLPRVQRGPALPRPDELHLVEMPGVRLERLRNQAHRPTQGAKVTNEPVAIVAAVNAAITATLAILLFVGVDSELVGALTLAATAWLGVGAAIVRSKVTPVEPAGVPDRGSLTTGDIVIVVALAFIVAILVIRFW